MAVAEIPAAVVAGGSWIAEKAFGIGRKPDTRDRINQITDPILVQAEIDRLNTRIDEQRAAGKGRDFGTGILLVLRGVAQARLAQLGGVQRASQPPVAVSPGLPVAAPPAFLTAADGGELSEGPGRRASSRANRAARNQPKMATPPQGSGLPKAVWDQIPPAAREKIIQIWIKLGPNGQKFFKLAAKRLARIASRVGQAGVLAAVFEFVDYLDEWLGRGDPESPPPEFEPEEAPQTAPKPAVPQKRDAPPVIVKPEVKVIVLPAPAPAPKPAPKPRPAQAPAPAPLPPLPPLPPAPRVPNPVFEIGRIIGGLILNRGREAAPARVRDSAVAPMVPQMMPQLAPALTLIGSRQAECVCPPKKATKKRKLRTVCYSGTFTETARGTRKRRKRKVPCRA